MPEDPVKVAPHVYKNLLENDKVRVLEAGGSAGLNTGMHFHPNQVAIALSDTNMRFTFPNGESAEAGLKAGEVMFLEPVEHTVELLGPGEGRLILVELK